MSESFTQASKPAQPELALLAVNSAALRREFVDLPYRLYANTPVWVPPLRRDEHRRLDPAHNPFFEHGEMSLWLARRGSRTVGRIAAIEDRLHNETHREKVAWFGFLEAADQETTDLLLRTVEGWARARGCPVVRGPANPSLNESAGALIDAFYLDPYIMMPFNPPEYPAYIEAAGYVKAKDLLAWEIDLTRPIPDRVQKIAARVSQRHGIVVRPLEPREFDRDLAQIQTIYRAAWEDNWGFVPPTDAEVRQLAADLKPVMDPELVLFAEINGRPVGCSVAIPDANQVLKKMNGRLLPFGLIHFLRRRQIVNRARLLLLGVLPEYRRIGLYPLLVAESHRRGVARGYVHGELSWTLEDNDAINAGIEAAGGRRYKTYRVYEKSLG
jgi:hypothetical protein